LQHRSWTIICCVSAGHCLRQAREPGYHAAEGQPQPAQCGRGARWPPLRGPARPELLLDQRGQQGTAAALAGSR
jgi:hypothetical protein